jgi:hypothetical protein
MKSKYKGVYYHPSSMKWTARKGLNGKRKFLGRFKTEYQAILRVKKFNRISELELIYKYVNDISGIDIGTDCREKPMPYLKALFAKIAFNVVDEVTLQEIAGVINVDHSSISFYKKTLIPEISKKYDYIEMYLNYPLVADSKTSSKITNYDNLIIEKNILLKENLELKNKILYFTDEKLLTPNEIKYRELSPSQQKDYNLRVEPILRMMQTKERKESAKYEKILCS